MNRTLPLILVLLSPVAVAQGGPGGGGPGAGGPLPPVPVPANNPITVNKTMLGKALFFEEQLSSTSLVSCATCHISSAGGADPRSGGVQAPVHPGPDGVTGTADDVLGSPGVPATNAAGEYTGDPSFGVDFQVTSRRSMPVINSAFVPQMFWDGRASGPFNDPVTGAPVSFGPVAPEVQASEPPLSAVEMAHGSEDWVAIAARIEDADPLALAENLPTGLANFLLGRDYPDLFQLAFGSPDVTPTRIIQAIATYERTLISDGTPFDAFLNVGPSALTPAQNRGLMIFNGPGRCGLCHNGPLFSDMGFHNIGLRPPTEDIGRQAVTGNPQDLGRFKTPHLRNVGLRAPYFHNGSAQTLAEVVDFYARGGDFGQNQDPLIIPLNLNPGQRADLVAFLQTGLTDPAVANETGVFSRPTLYSESARRPITIGAGTAGTGGETPRMIAVEPPRIGNDNCTLASDGFLGGAPLLFASDTTLNLFGSVVFGARVYLGFGPSFQILPMGFAGGAGAGEGFGSISFSIPDDPSLIGVNFFGQTFALDPGASGGLSATQAAWLTIF